MSRVLGAGAAAVCLLASLALPEASPAVAATSLTSAASVTVPQAGRISGVDLQTYNETTMSPDFAQIAADRANMVNITVWWEVPDSSSNAIAPGSMTMSDVNLVSLAESAEAAGMQVSLTPDFVVGSSGWRGQYNPPDPSTFFSNYTQMLDHYADMAQQLHMTMFWVGSEMVDSEQYTPQWDSAIASVRQHFTGRLLYDVNWSTTGNVQFYGALDAISISAYYPLSNQADPTEAQLLAAWHGANPDNGNWFAAVLALEQKWQKPIYFGEAGYSYSTYAAEAPYTESYDSADPNLQYRCYQALDDTFRGQSWWGGVLWWSWDGGVYNMDGEPAEALIGTSSVAYPQPSSAATPSPSTPSGTRPATRGSTSPSSSRARGSSAIPVSGSSSSSSSVSSGAGPAGTAGGGSAVASPSAASATTGPNAATGTGGGGRQADAAPTQLPTSLQAAGEPTRQPSGNRTALVVAGIFLLAVVVALLYTARKRGRLAWLPVRLRRGPTKY